MWSCISKFPGATDAAGVGTTCWGPLSPGLTDGMLWSNKKCFCLASGFVIKRKLTLKRDIKINLEIYVKRQNCIIPLEMYRWVNFIHSLVSKCYPQRRKWKRCLKLKEEDLKKFTLTKTPTHDFFFFPPWFPVSEKNSGYFSYTKCSFHNVAFVLCVLSRSVVFNSLQSYGL